jgi:hypothetical protein
MSGENDYRASVGVFELITALEGKRPDLLLFNAQDYRAIRGELSDLASGGNLARTALAAATAILSLNPWLTCVFRAERRMFSAL